MDKKIALVTGATSGIGEAIARRLAQEHHTVVLTGRNAKRLQTMEREMAKRGQRVVAIAGDLTREEEAQKVVAEALRTFGAVEVLVHSAGLFRVTRLEDSPAEEFRSVMDTNLTSLFFLSRALLPHFTKQGGGHIVAVSSVAARKGFPGETAYCASKWGLMGFLAALREEVRERGIRVTALLPGPTATHAWEPLRGKAALRLDRMMSAEMVAEAALAAINQPAIACVEEIVIAPTRDPFEGRAKD